MKVKTIIGTALCAVLAGGLSGPASAESAVPDPTAERASAVRVVADDFSAQGRKQAKPSRKAKPRKKKAAPKGGKGHLGHH